MDYLAIFNQLSEDRCIILFTEFDFKLKVKKFYLQKISNFILRIRWMWCRFAKLFRFPYSNQLKLRHNSQNDEDYQVWITWHAYWPQHVPGLHRTYPGLGLNRESLHSTLKRPHCELSTPWPWQKRENRCEQFVSSCSNISVARDFNVSAVCRINPAINDFGVHRFLKFGHLRICHTSFFWTTRGPIYTKLPNLTEISEWKYR